MRVRSEEQKTKESIETQDRFLQGLLQTLRVRGRRCLQGRGDLRAPSDARAPEGSRLLADAEEGAFDAVLVYRLDRIGRALLVVVDAHDRLGQAGIALKSATNRLTPPALPDASSFRC
jgi:DNA invertase Pin-like site-specific DNA recombinase